MVSIAEEYRQACDLGVSFNVDGDTIKLDGASSLTSQLRASMRSNKPALIEYLTSARRLLDDKGVIIEYVTNSDHAADLLNRILATGGPVGLDIETYVPEKHRPQPVVEMTRTGTRTTAPDVGKVGLDPHRAKVRLIQVFAGGGVCAVFDMLTVPWSALAPLWDRQLIIHNHMFELGFFKAEGVIAQNTECTMQAAGLMLGVGKRGLHAVAGVYLDWDIAKELQTSDWGKTDLSSSQLDYAALDAVAAFYLWSKLEKDLRRTHRWNAYTLQRDAGAAAVEMQWFGMGVDADALEELIREWGVDLNAAKSEWTETTGTPPPSTPAEIRVWLIENLSQDELEVWPRTAKGTALSTAAANLEQAFNMSAVKPLLEIKRLEKLLSTFGVGLRKHVSAITGRIHASYNVAGAKSGRWSCSKPNLQQAPGGRRAPGFRSIFRAPEGRMLIGADYSQMELRAAAEVSGDMALRDVYVHNLDLHDITAARMAGVSPDEVTKEQRNRAKPVNFGSIYGMGAKGLAMTAWTSYRQVMSEADADKALQAFFREFPTLKRWMSRHHTKCKRNKFITIGSGRVMENSWEKNGIRYTQSCNLPIQGVCADIMMRAVARVHTRLHEAKLDAVLVAQIHDEIILEADSGIAEEAKVILVSEMEKSFKTTFPDAPSENLVTDSIGRTWADLK
jgi:DNA polymerase I